MATPIHPELASAARWLPRGLGSAWVLKLLKRLPMPTPKLPPGVTRQVHALEGRGSASVRVIRPEGDGVRPALLWVHGGGYVIGSAAQDEVLCARFAQRLGITVVSVDYRLAPEHPFPEPLDDCFAAWEWLQREAPRLGIDRARVAIGGQSAGGGLAAALAQLIQERGAPSPRLQLLVYPMLDDRTVLKEVTGPFRLWSPASNALGWRWYLGREPGSDGVPPLAAPARRTSLAGLPQAWVGVGTCDLFHDEDVEYARRLRDAGVIVTVEIVPGAFHGFDAALPKNPVSLAFFEAQCVALERALAT